jgi:hypothetical protein
MKQFVDNTRILSRMGMQCGIHFHMSQPSKKFEAWAVPVEHGVHPSRVDRCPGSYDQQVAQADAATPPHPKTPAIKQKIAAAAAAAHIPQMTVSARNSKNMRGCMVSHILTHAEGHSG